MEVYLFLKVSNIVKFSVQKSASEWYMRVFLNSVTFWNLITRLSRMQGFRFMDFFFFFLVIPTKRRKGRTRKFYRNVS